MFIQLRENWRKAKKLKKLFNYNHGTIKEKQGIQRNYPTNHVKSMLPLPGI